MQVCALKTVLLRCCSTCPHFYQLLLMVEPFYQLELSWEEKQGNIQKRHEEGWDVCVNIAQGIAYLCGHQNHNKNAKTAT